MDFFSTLPGDDMGLMTIGKIAKQVGVGVETIRFYEREGLIPAPARSAAGYRLYSADMVKRVGFIRRAKDLGFSLKEIDELLALRVNPSNSCAQVKTRAEGKIADIEKKIDELLVIKTALGKLIKRCRGSGPTGDCPILAAMEPKEET